MNYNEKFNVGNVIINDDIESKNQINIVNAKIGVGMKHLLLNEINNNTKTIDERKYAIRNAYRYNGDLQNELLNNAIIDDMNDKMKHVIKLHDIDIDFELQSFFDNCSRPNSKHTKTLYMNNIRDFQNYFGRNIVYAKHNDAQMYLQRLINKQLSSRTIRVKIASISSFFTYLSHRYDCIQNIFVTVHETIAKN
jgi:hypothetical protein